MADPDIVMDPDDLQSDPDTLSIHSVSTVCSTTTFSDLGEPSFISKKQKVTAQKRSKKEKKKQKLLEKKKIKNKISMDDFYAKITEFKVWLHQVKNTKFDNLGPKQQQEQFKKFVKKWNSRKLDKKYYRGLDVLWAQGTPETQAQWALPRDLEMTPGSIKEDELELRYSRTISSTTTGLGTFRKKSDSKMLQELRNGDNTTESTAEKFLHPDSLLHGRVKPKTLALELLFVPPGTTRATDQENIKSEEEDWPAPPPPLGDFEMRHTDNLATENPAETPLTNRPITSGLGRRSIRPIKVDIPFVKPRVISRSGEPLTADGTKPRPVSCIASILPNRPMAPPRLSSSTNNVRERVDRCPGGSEPTHRGESDVYRRRVSSSCHAPPPPPRRTVSLETLHKDMTSSAGCVTQAQSMWAVTQKQSEQTVTQTQPELTVRQTQPELTVRQTQPELTVTQTQPELTVTPTEPEWIVTQTQPEQTIKQTQPERTVTQTQQERTVKQTQPELTVTPTQPELTVTQTEPERTVTKTHPERTVTQTQPERTVTQTKPDLTVTQTQPELTVTQTQPELTVTPTEPEWIVTQTQPEQTIKQTQPERTVTQTQQERTVKQTQPELTVTPTQPELTVTQTEPERTVTKTHPERTVTQTQPERTVTQTKPDLTVTQTQPERTVKQTKPELTVTQTQPERTVTQTQPEWTVTKTTISSVPQVPPQANSRDQLISDPSNMKSVSDLVLLRQPKKPEKPKKPYKMPSLSKLPSWNQTNGPHRMTSMGSTNQQNNEVLATHTQTHTGNGQAGMIETASYVTRGSVSMATTTERAPAQKRQLVDGETTNHVKTSDTSERRFQSTHEGSEKKIIRKDSYVSSLSSASYAVFQALNSTKCSVRPGQVTPVRLHATNDTASSHPPPGGATHHPPPQGGATPHPPPRGDKNEDPLTPGKSSYSTNL